MSPGQIQYPMSSKQPYQAAPAARQTIQCNAASRASRVVSSGPRSACPAACKHLCTQLSQYTCHCTDCPAVHLPWQAFHPVTPCFTLPHSPMQGIPLQGCNTTHLLYTTRVLVPHSTPGTEGEVEQSLLAVRMSAAVALHWYSFWLPRSTSWLAVLARAEKGGHQEAAGAGQWSCGAWLSF